MADIFSLVGRVSIEYAQAETALKRVSDAAEDTVDSLEDVGDTSEEVGGTTEKSGNRMVGAFKKIGAAVVAAFAVDKIVDFGKAVVDASATVAAEQSAFEQIMGDYSDTAQQKMNEVADTTGMVSTRLTPYMTSMTAKFKGLGYDIDDATTLAQDGLTLAADAAAFWDKSLEDSMGALNSFINGSYEGGEAIGLFANDTQLASYAVKQGIVSETKEWANLDEAKKQATRLEYAQNMMEASGATGQAAKEADQYANVQANLTEKWRQFKAQIGEPLLQNVVIPAMDKLSSGVDKASAAYQKCSKWIAEHKKELEIAKGVLLGLTVAVGSFLLIMNWGKIMTIAKTALLGVKTAMLAVNAAMAANPIGLVISLIAGLVAGFIYLWNASEEFRNFWIGLWETIKTAASDVWETIKDVVQVGIMFIGEIISFAFDIITLPWRFIWENVKEYVIPIWESIKNTVSNAINSVKTTIETVLNAIKTFFTNVWNSIKDTTTSVFNAVKDVVTSIWNSIKSTFETVLNTIKTVVGTVWNTIKDKTSSVFNGIKDTAKSVWDSIKNAIEKPINAAKDAVKKAIDKMKSFFDFEWSLPKLKLPHFEISGKFSLDPPSVPKFGIEWYKKAMDNPVMFTKPSVFGINPATGNMRGAGEAGDEVMIGKETMLNMIRQAVQEGNNNADIVRLLEILLHWFIDGGLTSVLIDLFTNHVSLEVDNREIMRFIENHA